MEWSFICPLTDGVHARPASALEEEARRHAARISITNSRTRMTADARSVLGIIGLDIRYGDECGVSVSGADEGEAAVSLKRFLEDDFPACDEPLAPIQPQESVRLPPVLRQLAAEFRAATPVVPGIGGGRAVVITGFVISESILTEPRGDEESEIGLLEDSLDRLAEDYRRRIESAVGSTSKGGLEGDLLRAHLSVARDPAFRERIEVAIRDGRTLAGAVADAEAHFSEMLEATGSELLRERALDITDVCTELLRTAYGERAVAPGVVLTAPSVCFADDLTPGQLLALDRTLLEGLVLGNESPTSHTAILARSFGIPTLGGAIDLTGPDLDDRQVIVDADVGILITEPTPDVLHYYELERDRLDARRARLARLAARPARTADGTAIELAVNIVAADEVDGAVAAGAEAVGLFRTEMLFLDRTTAPDEEEQFEAYRKAVLDAGGRRVVIRTLDIGGDKSVPWLGLPREPNPYLGYRAVRLYPENEPLFRTQIRALVRASAHGRLEIMVPMIARVEEADWIRHVIAEEQARCRDEGLPFDEAMPIGAMLEVPAAAFLIEELSRRFDFFSLGTNDLLQYFMAADRGNAAVADLLDPFTPAFLRLLRKIVDDVHASDRRVELCGELGGDLRALPLLTGLSLDGISMSARMIPAAKAELSRLSAAHCRELLDRAVNMESATQVEHLVAHARPSGAAPLIDPELVITAAPGDRAEAIKRLADILYVVGRTDEPRAVEEAVHTREAAYSTGFGFGFAIPHCRTDAVRSSSLAVLRSTTPLEWGSLDGEPVHFVMLLAVPESDAVSDHLKTIAALARRLMHAEFRDSLLNEQDPAALCRILSDAVRV